MLRWTNGSEFGDFGEGEIGAVNRSRTPKEIMEAYENRFTSLQEDVRIRLFARMAKKRNVDAQQSEDSSN